MSEEEVVYYGAPTLAGLKTGNLMSCPYESRQKTMDELRVLNDELVPKGICLYPLRFHNGRVLVYMFRPSFLQRDLSDKRAWEILDAAGYSRCDYSSCMMELIRRLRSCKSSEFFPHEIGLFLSYPPEDVKGFMEDPDGCKCVGTWKVYGDEQAARKMFDSFNKCTDIYCREWKRGTKLSKLAVKI